MKGKWLEVFKSGTHIDASGKKHTYTATDLDNIVKIYNDQPASDKHTAPICIGHPKDNAPAYGWIESLKRNGEKLLAKVGDVQPEFTEWFGKKLFQKKSISLYPNQMLRHLAFLGAVPPAVKGLSDQLFKESDEHVVFDFAETASTLTCPSCSNDVPGESNFCPSCGSKITKKFCRDCGSTMLQGLKACPTCGSGSFYSDPEHPEVDAPAVSDVEPPKEETLEEKLAKVETKTKELEEQNAELMKQVENSKANEVKLREAENKNSALETKSYLESLNNLTPAQKTQLAPIFEVVKAVELEENEGKKGFEFSEYKEDGTVVKNFANPLDLVKQFVEGIKVPMPVTAPKPREFGEVSNTDDAFNKEALAYKEEQAKKGKKITLASAQDAVRLKNSKKC